MSPPKTWCSQCGRRCFEKKKKKKKKGHVLRCGDCWRVVVERAVERALARAEEASFVSVPEGAQCYICWDSGNGLMSQGCACRGGSGFVHADCLEATTGASRLETLERHKSCGTCRQMFTGRLVIEMMVRSWRRWSKNRDEAARAAAWSLAQTLEPSDFLAIEKLQADAVRGLPKNDPETLMGLVDRGNTLRMVGREPEALEILEKALPRVQRYCPEACVATCCSLMSRVLHQLNRHEESLDFAKKALDIAKKTDDDDKNNEDFLEARYAMALAQNGQQQQATTILTALRAIADHTHGTHHPWTTKLEDYLQQINSTTT